MGSVNDSRFQNIYVHQIKIRIWVLLVDLCEFYGVLKRKVFSGYDLVFLN